MLERPLFRIPIYSFSKDVFKSKMDKIKKEYVKYVFQFKDGSYTTQEYLKTCDSIERINWYPWRFNEVVGWLFYLCLKP